MLSGLIMQQVTMCFDIYEDAEKTQQAMLILKDDAALRRHLQPLNSISGNMFVVSSTSWYLNYA